MNTKNSSFKDRLYTYRFELLLTSLLCVFVLNIFFPDNIYGGMAQAVYLPFQLLAATVLFESKKSILWLVLLFGVLLVICRALDLFFTKNIQNELLLLYICFFGSVTLEVFRQIYHADMVTTKIVIAAVCGLLLIGYCGFYIFLTIEYHEPGSFNNLGPGVQAMNDLFYFSYLTILTEGFSEVTPKTWIAKNATVLVAFTAYIYSLVVIATIVGEAAHARKKSEAEAAPEQKP